MSEIALTYIVNPLDSFLKSFNRFFITLGYARAAGELARRGMHEEAQRLMNEKLKLELEKK